jgi:hypothetical protein
MQKLRGTTRKLRGTTIKKLQVWWVPQVPGASFTVAVSSVAEGVKILHALADYDRFQFENHIKPDYSNAGGLCQWSENCDGEDTPGWEDWYDEDTGEDDPYLWVRIRAAERA